MTLKSRKAIDLGFPEGPPGHKMGDMVDEYANPTGWQVDRYLCKCECGYELRAMGRKDGKISVGTIHAFRNHIDALIADPDEVFEIGKIIKPRVTWRLLVINRDHQYASDYANTSRWQAWPTSGGQPGWYSHYPWAIVVDKGKRGKSLLGIYMGKKSAIRKAHEEITKAEDKGFQVEYVDAMPTAAAISIPTYRNTFSELLERTDSALAGSMVDVENALNELNEVLSLVPLLQTKRDEVAAVWDKRTVGLLNP